MALDTTRWEDLLYRFEAISVRWYTTVVAEVVGTDAFDAWFLGLDASDTDAVKVAVDLLEARGLALGFPWSNALRGTRYALRELRVQARGKAIRIAYAFDPERRAVVLLGAHKSGSERRFYRRFVGEAESRWVQYLATRDDKDGVRGR